MMTASSPQSNLSTAEALYRLALLALGDGATAELATWDALRDAVPGKSIAELAPALLRRAPRRWQLQPSTRMLTRAGMSAEDLQILLGALSGLTPAQRLALGLVALRGLSWTESASIVGRAGRRPRDPRPQIGIALGLLPDASSELSLNCQRCIEAIQHDDDPSPSARQHLTGCESCQAVRKGWADLKELLRAALPGLFVASPEVLRRFAGPPPAVRLGRWPQLVLLGVVGALVAFLLLRPSPATEASPSASQPPTNQQVIERSIRRLELPLPEGAAGSIVHEVVELSLPRFGSAREEQPQRVTMERWYDHASPARLRLELREGSQLIYGIAADGTGRVQLSVQRSFWRRGRGQEQQLVQLDPAVAAQVIPLLRQPSAISTLVDPFGTVEEWPLFAALQAARANPDALQALGSTSFLDRSAWLLSVRTPERRYLLTIDQQTYAVLDLQSLVAEGAEGQPGQSTEQPYGLPAQGAEHPWRTTLLEVLETLPAYHFQLSAASASNKLLVRDPLPPSFWLPRNLPDNVQLLPTEELPGLPLLLPDPETVPAALRSVIWGQGDQQNSFILTSFWSEYGLVSIYQLPVGSDQLYESPVWTHEEAGRRFRMDQEAFGQGGERLSIDVDVAPLLPAGQPMRYSLGLSLPLATPLERETLVRRVIRSLAPATPERLAGYDNFKVVGP